ncbi:MAG: trehalose-6-phosphate synthase [Kiloniellales bacterium]|nr:trehalose-6-phosphate synthase [Kiloniellales bacterium]
MGRLVIISNRVARIEEGKSTSGGLAVGVLDALRAQGGLWFGWDGEIAEQPPKTPHLTVHGPLTYATFPLSPEDYDAYYGQYANRVLWPLLHGRADLVEHANAAFQGYTRVNRDFAAKLLPLLQPDDIIWVHDYHLFPLGEELRRGGATQRIGFFLHIPFPTLDTLRILPEYRRLVEAIKAYDLIGFQTQADLEAFREASDHYGEGARLGVFPIGVDTGRIAEIAETAAQTPTVARMKESLAAGDLIVGVDRLDYTKGLERRFESYAGFLESYPEFQGRVTFLQIAPPTRGHLPEYRSLRRRLSTLAGEIAGRFSQPDWTPIRYINRNFARRTLLGFFRASQVALVTPLRDGMNLVAKEFVASQAPDDPGVLVLSAFAGAAQELDGALIVNPYDPDAMAEALREALRMPLEERQARWRPMLETLQRQDVTAWREAFVASLTQVNRKVA